MTMQEAAVKHVKCNLCGADDYSVMFPSTVGNTPPAVDDYVSTAPRYGEYHDIVKCHNCGLIYMNPVDSKITDLYGDVVDQAYLDSWEERAETFRRHLDVLRGFKPEGELLDIGCYAGIFLSEAARKGYSVTGVEPSKWASDFARNRTGAEVITGSWDTATIQKNAFDIVTLWDVIEHLEDPASCLAFVHDRLKPGGMVAVTTHDIGSLFARVMGRKYPWLMRFHLYHFTPTTLSAMLSRAGLKPVLTMYYSKRFSLKYFLSRFGIKVKGKLFEKISIPIYTGDMMLIVAEKK